MTIKIVERLQGTSNNNIEGLSIEEIEEIMLDAGYERCPECDVWVECGELIDDNDEQCSCESCR